MSSNIDEAKPPFLSGRYTNSFAFPTLKDRVPTIICKVIDLLHRQRRYIEPEHDQNSLKACIEKMVSSIRMKFDPLPALKASTLK